jgi:hypothetical protein
MAYQMVAPRYKMSSVLSVVVMVSAFLLLYQQSQNRNSSFTFDIELGRYFLADGNDLFHNSYRYLN